MDLSKVNKIQALGFLDKVGHPIPVKLSAAGKPFVFLQSGKLVEIVSVLKDLNGRPIFLDSEGNAIQFDQGEAGGNDVLMAQNGSLVYFASLVNDVYAYFATGTKDGGIVPTPTQFPTTQFPTTQAALAQIVAFGQAHGKTFPDTNTLAIEVKSAWIETNNLDVSKYITMTATIPTYDTSSSTQWTPKGTKVAGLALVGMHVVGSVAGHPEMIWATFEHVDNTPDAAYAYTSNTQASKTVNQNTAGNWLFCSSGSAGPFNNSRMSFQSPNIVANPGQTIGPSDTLREKAWGAASDKTPNPLDGTPADSNSEIISINNSILGMLASGDVRGNYIMTGATWTIGGAPPSAPFPGGNEVGTSQMADTTMETYEQGTSLQGTGMNCLDCHQGSGTSVSHMFGPLQPLFQ